jgi:hypothetical protein
MILNVNPDSPIGSHGAVATSSYPDTSANPVSNCCRNAVLMSYASALFSGFFPAGESFSLLNDMNDGAHHTIPRSCFRHTSRIIASPTSRCSGTLLHRISSPRIRLLSSGTHRYAVEFTFVFTGQSSRLAEYEY